MAELGALDQANVLAEMIRVRSRRMYSLADELRRLTAQHAALIAHLAEHDSQEGKT